jgi:menaquinone-9 beta-reductase
MLGDAAGMITPLCGNGMSMALHSSKIAAALIEDHLQNKISLQQMQQQYCNIWQQKFEKRMATGRFMQRFFGKEKLTDLFVGLFKQAPFLSSIAIKKTHGQPY